MSNCIFCYQKVEDQSLYHANCCKKFFGTKTLPELQLDKTLLNQLAIQTVNRRIAVTGVQPKLSVNLSKEVGKNRLTLVGLWGQYILKPQHEEFPYMPETEDLTTHLAGLFKIRTSEHALIPTSEGKLAYITKRFDREKGKKIHVEDLCQISGFLTEQKYKSSYEKAGKLISTYCTNKGLDTLNFFELVLFCYLTGNNDMHLKNFTLIHHPDRTVSLSPAYDLLNINLIFPADAEELALTLNGKKRRITKKDFDKFAASLNLPEKAVSNSYSKFINATEKVEKVILSSFLPEEMKMRYLEIWKSKISQF
ncbi:HipA domain-containing protein [Algoriphagus confluentis]|uniref:HipA domain-containing protein n=1 Tax=Algoriphagus confluentis TaxID=1697556 RepID=A0ABQ6PMH6_9BACT|nr:HipA domain-containing protein [Algoriphagus confluentis]